MHYQTDLRQLELSFRRAVKAFEVAFRRDVFLGLKSTASEKLYTKSLPIDHDHFRFLTKMFTCIKTTVGPVVPTIAAYLPRRELLCHPYLSGPGGKPVKYVVRPLRPYASCKNLARAKKKVRRKRRTESKPIKHSSNPSQWQEYSTLTCQLNWYREAGKKVTREEVHLNIDDSRLKSFLAFEEAGDWNVRGRADQTLQGFLNCKFVNARTVLIVYCIRLVYSESSGTKKCMLKYKTAKLNSNQVLEMPPGTSAAEWRRVAGATDSSKGESIIMRARMAGVEVSTDFPSRFFCRRPGPGDSDEGGEFACTPLARSGPYLDQDFVPGVTFGHGKIRGGKEAKVTRALARGWMRQARTSPPTLLPPLLPSTNTNTAAAYIPVNTGLSKCTGEPDSESEPESD